MSEWNKQTIAPDIHFRGSVWRGIETLPELIPRHITTLLYRYVNANEFILASKYTRTTKIKPFVCSLCHLFSWAYEQHLPPLFNPNAYVWPSTTHVILTKRIPFTAVNVPAGCLVFRIFLAFVFTGNDSNSLPGITGRKCTIPRMLLNFNTEQKKIIIKPNVTLWIRGQLKV